MGPIHQEILHNNMTIREGKNKMKQEGQVKMKLGIRGQEVSGIDHMKGGHSVDRKRAGSVCIADNFQPKSYLQTSINVYNIWKSKL